jgi:hypothetical protein
MRNNYWSCSKFADWLRGSSKGGAKTADGWDLWTAGAKAKHPVRYWIAEEVLDKVQNFICWPLDKIYNIKYYINNRWVTRTHALTAHSRDIKPGQWQDLGYRFLPCLFNELQDYVEMELAWFHLAWENKQQREKYNAPFWATGWFRWRTWRCPQAGLDNLAWQMGIKADESYGLNPGDKGYNEPTQQAKNAKEILELYKWWTEVYRNRPDPHDASGWSEYCERKRQEFPNSSMGLFRETNNAELKKLGDRALKLSQKIEMQYEREDEQMMIRLIKIRNSLWT